MLYICLSIFLSCHLQQQIRGAILSITLYRFSFQGATGLVCSTRRKRRWWNFRLYASTETFEGLKSSFFENDKAPERVVRIVAIQHAHTPAPERCLDLYSCFLA